MSTASTIVVIVVAVIFLGFFIKLLKTPIKLAFKLLLHAVGGFVMLFLVNFFGSYLGISLEMSWLNAIVSGVLLVCRASCIAAFQVYSLIRNMNRQKLRMLKSIRSF